MGSIEEIGTDLRFRIYTLPVLRNELRNYKYFDAEKQKIISNYSRELKRLDNVIQEYDSKLLKISSPTGGNDNVDIKLPKLTKAELQEVKPILEKALSRQKKNSTTVKEIPQSKEGKYHYYLDLKQKAEEEKQTFLANRNFEYLSEIANISARINTVNDFIEKLDEIDRQFVIDYYISNMRFEEVKEKYKIQNDGNLTRKANNILKKYLR